MRWVEVATQRGAITRLLAKHGLGPQPPPAQRTDLSWALPKRSPTPLDSRRLTGTGGESDPNHFELNFRALVCKVACRLRLLPTRLAGFESLPLR